MDVKNGTMRMDKPLNILKDKVLPFLKLVCYNQRYQPKDKKQVDLSIIYDDVIFLILDLDGKEKFIKISRIYQ